MRRTYGTLDGLRGVAALLVASFHVVPGAQRLPFLGSAYLSVDLFFLLSGFVIGHAYDDRLLRGMTAGRFARARLLRLYPLYILGCGIGMAAVAATALVHHSFWIARPAIVALPWALMMVPKPVADPAYWFVLDPPAWSLFYEMAVNILYVMLFPRLTNRVLKIILATSAVALFVQGVGYETLNFEARGWALAGSFARPAFSFAAGLFLLRCRRRGALPEPRAPALTALVLFLLMLLAVPPGGIGAGIVAPVMVTLGFPLVLVIAVANEPSPATAPAMTWAGRLSFPIYALHMPMMAILGVGASLAGVSRPFVLVAAMPLTIMVAQLALTLYDDPLRRALRSQEPRLGGTAAFPGNDGNRIVPVESDRAPGTGA